MNRRATFLLALAFGSAITWSLCLADSSISNSDASQYPSIEAGSQEEPSLRFVFSASDATSSDPVVISAVGRALTIEDGEHRVSLQKYWVSQQFTNDYRVVDRYSAECDLKRPNEISGCDVYVVEDLVTRQEVTFFIYMGNWPHLYGERSN
jgi:hypothetical protein